MLDHSRDDTSSYYCHHPKNSVLPLVYDIIASNKPQMKIKAVSQRTVRFNIKGKLKNVGVYLEISLLDCLTTKKSQDFSRTFPKFQQNSRILQDFPGLFSNSSTFLDVPGLVGTMCLYRGIIKTKQYELVPYGLVDYAFHFLFA